MKIIKVAYVTSQIVGVPYSYCVLMKRLGINTTLYRRKIKNKGYGGESGNPFNVDIKFLSDNTIIRYNQILEINDDYDIVHLHDGGGIFEAIFCGFGKAKVIYHFHGSSIREGMPRFTFKSYIKKLYWRYIGIHNKVLVSTVDLLPHWKGAELLLDPIDQMILKVPRIRNIEHPYILSPHSCDDGVKGTYKIFDAWNILKQKYPEYKLHVINWGIDAPYYKELTKDDSSVIWHDFLQRKEYIELLSGSTVNWGEFVIPAYGLTEIEAFAMGVPDISDPKLTAIDIAKKTELLILNEDMCFTLIAEQKQRLIKYDVNTLCERLYNIYMDVLK